MTVTTHTLFDLTLALAGPDYLGILYESLATGGSTTTIADTIFLDQRDDYWNKGSAWIIRDAGGSNAAPEGEFARVTDFDQGTNLATIQAVSVAVAAGDRYGIAKATYRLDQMIGAINAVLRRTPLITEDTTTIDSAQGQTEYSLPTTLLDEQIDVLIQTKTGDTDDNRWVRFHDWEIFYTAQGTAQKIIFKRQPTYIRDFRIRMNLPHAELYASSDKLHESIHPERIISEAAHMLVSRRMKDMNDTDPDLQRIYSELTAKAQRMQARHRVMKAGNRPKLATFGAIDGQQIIQDTG